MTAAGVDPRSATTPKGGYYSWYMKTIMKDALRFMWKEDGGARISWEKFTKDVVGSFLSLTGGGVLCIYDNAREKCFDLALKSKAMAARVLETCRARAGEEPLSRFEVVDLGQSNVKLVTVYLYDPHVPDEEVLTYLRRFGEILSPVRKLCGPGAPFWDGRRQVKVCLAEDPAEEGGTRHIPAYVTLGSVRGRVYYPGQPPSCRRCRGTGHTEASCGGLTCRACGEVGHIARACSTPKKCHGCGAEDHLVRRCPGGRRAPAAVVRMESEEAGPSGGGPRGADYVGAARARAAPEVATPVAASLRGGLPPVAARPGVEEAEPVALAEDVAVEERVDVSPAEDGGMLAAPLEEDPVFEGTAQAEWSGEPDWSDALEEREAVEAVVSGVWSPPGEHQVDCVEGEVRSIEEVVMDLSWEYPKEDMRAALLNMRRLGEKKGPQGVVSYMEGLETALKNCCVANVGLWEAAVEARAGRVVKLPPGWPGFRLKGKRVSRYGPPAVSHPRDDEGPVGPPKKQRGAGAGLVTEVMDVGGGGDPGK